MNENNILNLITKFEKTLSETEKLTNALMGLEGVLEKLDISISDIYELTKTEDLTNKSIDLINSIKQLKKVQEDVNTEFNEFINLKLYKEGLKDDIYDIKNHLINTDKELLNIKNEFKEQRKFYQNENLKLKQEILLNIKEYLNNNTKDICLDDGIKENNYKNK